VTVLFDVPQNGRQLPVDTALINRRAHGGIAHLAHDSRGAALGMPPAVVGDDVDDRAVVALPIPSIGRLLRSRRPP
jgi:hypothetical protein